MLLLQYALQQKEDEGEDSEEMEASEQVPSLLLVPHSLTPADLRRLRLLERALHRRDFRGGGPSRGVGKGREFGKEKQERDAGAWTGGGREGK